ncbi:hypothetical protein [Phyllobacterium leguminum]|uniref:Uncharacterized protein n=1 Tax=Phyllobacterium leguminum TaxID=314237 RepID=A0A318T1W1_9HYPH|nr:hypothetical protein [Phyllobacterium leguminum]PYE87775.1 hypothetical protein C7477_111123 [Phyllobacterium leguminum]
MSAAGFTWHPEQDDVYDGNIYGNTTLTGLPSAFDKGQPYNFTMKGPIENSLTLQPTGAGRTNWGNSQGNGAAPTNFYIEGGTFTYRSQKEEELYVGYGSVVFTVMGHCHLLGGTVNGYILNEQTPTTLIVIKQSGVFNILTREFVGGLSVNIGDGGSMRLGSTRALAPQFSRFNVHSTVPDGGYSLDISATAVEPIQTAIVLEKTSITCQGNSKTRVLASFTELLANKTIAVEGTIIDASDNAVVEFRCDRIHIDEGCSFVLKNGSAAFFFSNKYGTEKLPLDLRAGKNPKAIFNFVTTKGANTGTFRFRATSAADARQQFLSMLSLGLFAIDGTPYTSTINGYSIVNEPPYTDEHPYLVMRLKHS